MPEITEHEDGITQVKISMSYPLRWVNSYLITGPGGITVIDPGPLSAETKAEWHKAMKQLNITFKDVEAVVLTHHHPDHLGLSGWFQQHSGCPVWMSGRSFQEMQLMWGTDSTMNTDLPDLFREQGMPEEWTSQLAAHLSSFISQVTPRPDPSFITSGEPFNMGGRSWIPVETSGHASGHLSFYEEESGIILCGDAVLPQISPNVSLLPGSDPQPLYSFLNGLKKLQAYSVSRAYPGHRNPFAHFNERLGTLLLHHEERLTHVRELLQAAPATGFQLCDALFGTKLGIHQMRFAMCETLAHTKELERRSQIQLLNEKDGVLRYIVC